MLCSHLPWNQWPVGVEANSSQTARAEVGIDISPEALPDQTSKLELGPHALRKEIVNLLNCPNGFVGVVPDQHPQMQSKKRLSQGFDSIIGLSLSVWP